MEFEPISLTTQGKYITHTAMRWCYYSTLSELKIPLGRVNFNFFPGFLLGRAFWPVSQFVFVYSV